MGCVQVRSKKYSKLTQVTIVNQNKQFTELDQSLACVIQKRKFNHEQWKKYKHNKNDSERQHKNKSNKTKIDKIKMEKSTYSPSSTERYILKPHSYYFRRKREQAIDNQNPSMAKRIISVEPSLSLTKIDLEYEYSRNIMHRIQKFSALKRLAMICNKKVRIKTQSTKLMTCGLKTQGRKYSQKKSYTVS